MFSLLTEYMHKHFNAACTMFMSKKYLFLSLFGCSIKYILDLKEVNYVIRKCKTTTYQQSYLVRTCRLWNGLADELHFNTDSLSVFKSILLKYYYQSLELNYDPDNPRTLKTICLKCNSVRILARPVSCCY